MLFDTNAKEIILTLNELISFSYPSGSLVREKDFFEKPKTALSIVENIADNDARFMQAHAFSAIYEHEGYHYSITAMPDLCSIHNTSVEIINVRASGGKRNASSSLMETWERIVTCSAVICADSIGVKQLQGKLIYSFDSRIAPDEIIFADDYDKAKRTLEETIHKAAKLISIHIERKTKRMPSAHDAHFPFESKRAGQSDFMTSVLLACKNGTKLLCEAPTGIGKTMSALFPSVKAFGHGFIDKIFYLTPKTTAQYAAENAAKAIFPYGDGIRTIILSAKDKMCLMNTPTTSAESTPDGEGRSAREESKCERCTAAVDYYSRRCDALNELLSKYTYLTPSLVSEIAKKHTICPYELSLDASEYCDLIICDYNYLFDCRVYLRRYFDMFRDATSSSKKYLPSYAVLIDEAHNLPDRARNMYSHTLRTHTLQKLLSEFGMTELEKKAKGIVEEILSEINKYSKACAENEATNERGEICGWCVESSVNENILLSAQEFTECYESIKRADLITPSTTVTDFYFNLKDLQKKSEYFSDKFKVLCEKTGANITYRIMCLDPSQILEEKCGMAKSSVMFSATVSPSDYYMQTLGMNKNSDYMSIPSPYDKENFSLTVFDTLSTRYKDRSETLYALAQIVNTAIKTKRGNYMIFFPSYKYMEEAHGFFTVMFPEVETLIQRKGMTEEQKAAFVAKFDENNKASLVGFCVLGGVYAEGIDLVGEKLIGAIIVGVGMPRLSNERNLLAEHYSDGDIDGSMYSYVYPGMTRVMQAVGRVIRTESDRGIAILIDDRFATPVYKSLFPSHWRHAKFVSDPKAISKILEKFWK